MPRNNRWAVIQALGVLVLMAAAGAFLRFLESGDPFPTTLEGWVRVLGPGVLAAILSTQTTRFSLTEFREGYRTVTPPPAGSDAPVVNVSKPPTP